MRVESAQEYDFREVEKKWRTEWNARQTYRTPDPGPHDKTFYVLDMFPYPSGYGLHVGHPVGYIASDVVARFKRMNGFLTLHPMGWDAFGLPAEREAIRTGQSPQVAVKTNIANYRHQMDLLGLGYDWEREINTTDPAYYRWTQTFFLALYNAWFDHEQQRARPIQELPIPSAVGDQGPLSVQEFLNDHRLAYFSWSPVNWCPELGTVLANEEVFDGRSEQGYEVVQRPMRQLTMRISVYAKRLLAGLEGLDWPEGIKDAQRNWIGESHGAYIKFNVEASGADVEVFTTRIDTLAGATFIAVAPDHPRLESFVAQDRVADVDGYREKTARKSELSRIIGEEKTGIPSGRSALNPLTGELLPIYVADYVLASYGTGAIMGVPAHDKRDMEFALAHGLPVRAVIAPPAGYAGDLGESELWEDEGIMAGSAPGDGIYAMGESSGRARASLIAYGVEHGFVIEATEYRIKDWIFSRQRYWGEPIPLMEWDDGLIGQVPIEELPLTLPHMDEFQPTPDGQSALARATEWVQVVDHVTGRKGKRETTTMPQWAGSCWYPLRFMDPDNGARWVDPAKERTWGSVDLYIGGAEHATLHLLYARFWYYALHDLGRIETLEPFDRLVNQGMLVSYAFKDDRGVIRPVDEVEEVDDAEPRYVHRETGTPVERVIAKMSKSLRNVVNPDDVVERYGADAFRVYLMFMAPVEGKRVWDTRDVVVGERFVHRVWRFVQAAIDRGLTTEASPAVFAARADLVREITEDYENVRLNTATAELMKFLKAVQGLPVDRETIETFVKVLSPLAPFIAEELWELLGHTTSITTAEWPKMEELRPERTSDAKVIIQVRGKKRDEVLAASATGDEELRKLVIDRLIANKRVAEGDDVDVLLFREQIRGGHIIANVVPRSA